MKSRLLTKILNNTKYNVADWDTYIGVGSPLCHDLIRVDKSTLELSYALNFVGIKGKDRGDSDKEYLRRKDNTELLFIYETLERLISTGEIKDIIEGKDEIENAMTVYSVKRNYTDDSVSLIEAKTEAIEWPRKECDGIPVKTDSGEIMYNNTHFKKVNEAIAQGKEEESREIDMLTKQMDELQKKINEKRLRIQQCHTNIAKLNFFLRSNG